MQTAQPRSRMILHEGDPAGLPVVAGCPFAVGAAAWDGASAIVEYADGRREAAQAHPLAAPTAGGVQWCELSLLAREAGTVTVRLEESSPSAGIVRQLPSGVVLETSRLRVTLHGEGAPVPVSVECRGADGAWRPFGTLSPEVVTTHGLAHRDAGRSRTARVLRNGPLRGQAELIGQLASPDGVPSLTYRLTIEVWRDLQAIRIDWMLAHLIPGQPQFPVQRATLQSAWQLGEETQRRFLQQNHSIYYVPREVCNPEPVALIADFTCLPVHAADPAMLRDETDYPGYLMPPTIHTGAWLAVDGTQAGVAATVVDFAETRPNALRSEGSRLCYDLIPDGHAFAWPQGRRREHTLLVAARLPGESRDDARLRRELAAVDAAGRAQPAVESLEALDCFDLPVLFKDRRGGNSRLAMFLRELCRIETPGDKWNLGDTPDPGYTLGYAGVPNRFEWLPGAPHLPVRFFPGAVYGLMYPPEMHQFVEPVWANNEYDMTHVLAMEVLRTGSREQQAMLRWNARHTIEVDFVAYSDDRWHHRATPAHSQHHNTTGAYHSHFWTQGLLEYYCLTGDRDALEVACSLGDKIIERLGETEHLAWKFDRESGWGMLALVCLAEVTGIARYREMSDRIAGYIMSFDRTAFAGAVNLSNGDPSQSLERQMVTNCFGYISLVEAMNRYYRLTGREAVAAWLRTLLAQLHEHLWACLEEGAYYGLTMDLMAVAYAYLGDEECLQAGMAVLDNLFAALATGKTVALLYTGCRIPGTYVKPSAMCYRDLARFLGHADRAGLLDSYAHVRVRAHAARRAGS